MPVVFETSIHFISKRRMSRVRLEFKNLLVRMSRVRLELKNLLVHAFWLSLNFELHSFFLTVVVFSFQRKGNKGRKFGCRLISYTDTRYKCPDLHLKPGFHITVSILDSAGGVTAACTIEMPLTSQTRVSINRKCRKQHPDSVGAVTEAWRVGHRKCW